MVEGERAKKIGGRLRDVNFLESKLEFPSKKNRSISYRGGNANTGIPQIRLFQKDY